METVLVLGCKGCGSAIAESFLTLGGIAYQREEVNYDEVGPARDRLLSYNPLGQVPTVVLPDGSVLTETLAIANYVQRINPAANLIPTGPLLEFVKYQRWSVFMISALYPTWTYGDTPAKWVRSASGAGDLRTSTDEHRKKLWQLVERECGAPYFLGETFSAVDVYIAVMTRWRPGKAWFIENCPRVNAVADLVANRDELKPVWNLNF